MNREERVAAYLETGAWPAEDPEGPPDGLRQLRALLGDERAWQEPPPELADAIVADIERERHSFPPEAPLTPPLRPRAEPAHPPAERRRSVWVTRAGIGLAAGVVLLAVLIVARPFSEPLPDEEQIPLAGTELAPEASAVASADTTGAGVRLLMEPSGLPPAPDGHYYQGWVHGPRGSVSIGTFHWRESGRPVALWSGVTLEDYPELTITLEPETDDPLSSGQVVLRGTYTP
ncbi:MAG: hypothetical protein GEU81_02235 [Nitriliruptorales bacterium]|nr:hypothetical protein [Nitriliruptorales bacterium]